ncbi:hypothetical protein NC653_010816 [Populus alba x Populus x berolinensis]|uniref:Uncharacterized protein n=1 Tax=Populus alba x Populus x berolinensis TaxID=444605 RepID=A0AAD6W6T5_9ROSI|nr:hypothetical protein NC653_010816 [Populus alba x Populus x berolinensis]
MDSKRKYNQYLTIILFLTIIFVSCSNPIMAARPSGSDDHQLGDYAGNHDNGPCNSCLYVPRRLGRCRIGVPPV